MENSQQLNQENSPAKDQIIEARVKNYAGPEGLTTKQLEAGLWYVEHKQLLRNILNGLLILVGAVSLAYSIYGFADYLVRGLDENRLLVKKLVEAGSLGHDYVLQVGAKPLAVPPVGILKSADKKYDFYVQLRNFNPKWWAKFDYYFMADGQALPNASGFILPMEAKYLMALARDFTVEPAAASLVIENIQWQRIDRHKFPDWNAYYRSHLDIESAEINFTPPNASQLSEKLNLNRLDFKVINHTAFNYWEAGFSILLYNGDNLANINYYTLNDFMSGEERPISLSWPGNIGRVDKFEIIPEIDIMRDDIYIKYEGGIGQEK